jgi:hypothetical protein
MNDKFMERVKAKLNAVILTGSFEQRYLQAVEEVEKRYPDLVKIFTSDE